MSELRPYCLSIAGYDPCGGAGVLADIKTFECLGVYGLAAVSSITYQNDSEFTGLKWLSFDEIKKQLNSLKIYELKTAKIGLIESVETLKEITKLLKEWFPEIFIVWDPVLKATAGFDIHEDLQLSSEVLKNIDLITPNFEEYEQLKVLEKKNDCAVLLKGGNLVDDIGTDTLYFQNTVQKVPGKEFKDKKDKHGTGCVLSSAITAYIAKGVNLYNSCVNGKAYVEQFIQSNEGRLGFHIK